MKRVVVTGIGAITPLGNDIPAFWNGIIEGKSGAQGITRFDASLFKTNFACEVKKFDAHGFLDKNDFKRTDLFTQYALGAVQEAIADSHLPISTMDPFDIGVIWGSGQGGMGTFEEEVKQYVEGNYKPRFSPFFVPRLITNMASGMISIKYGLMGINYTTVSACATSNTALMDAFNYIRWGKAKVIITGGSEAPITPASLGGFSSMKSLSTNNNDPERASRPFDKERNGFVLGEGAGALILEEYEHAIARHAKIYAEIKGAAMTADAYHMTSTHPDGLGAFQAMKLALEDGQISPEEVDYINAHATSTTVGDLSEIKAIGRLIGKMDKKVYMSATKSMTGHLLGAAGAIEAIICVLTIKNSIIPPTINTQDIDFAMPSACHLVLKNAIKKDVRIAMSNTFGFGGHNGIVIFMRPD